jgi:hypothetical protein
MPDDDLTEFLKRAVPTAEGQRFETMLVALGITIRAMDRTTLLAFRQECSKHRMGPEQTTVLEMIDGELALRTISGQ